VSIAATENRGEGTFEKVPHIQTYAGALLFLYRLLSKKKRWTRSPLLASGARVALQKKKIEAGEEKKRKSPTVPARDGKLWQLAAGTHHLKTSNPPPPPLYRIALLSTHPTLFLLHFPPLLRLLARHTPRLIP